MCLHFGNIRKFLGLCAWCWFGAASPVLGLAPSVEPEESAQAVLLAQVKTLEESAVRLHKSYTDWLRSTGRFDERSEDGLYANLCTFRTGARVVATQARSMEAPRSYRRHVEELLAQMELFERYLAAPSVEIAPALRDLFGEANCAVDSFRSVYETMAASVGASLTQTHFVGSSGIPRRRMFQLVPTRADVMSFLESRWGAR